MLQQPGQSLDMLPELFIVSTEIGVSEDLALLVVAVVRGTTEPKAVVISCGLVQDTFDELAENSLAELLVERAPLDLLDAKGDIGRGCDISTIRNTGPGR